MGTTCERIGVSPASLRPSRSPPTVPTQGLHRSAALDHRGSCPRREPRPRAVPSQRAVARVARGRYPSARERRVE